MSSPESMPAPEAAIQRGARLLAEGDAAQAIDVLRGLVAEAPIYAAAHVLLAASLDAAGQTDEGLDVWHRAAFLVPSSRLVQRKRLRLPEPPTEPVGMEPSAPMETATEPPVSASPDVVADREPSAPTQDAAVGAPHVADPAVAKADDASAADGPSEPDAEAPSAPDTPYSPPPYAPPIALAPVPEPQHETEPETEPEDAFATAALDPPSPLAEETESVSPDAESTRPEGARVASPDELFTEIPAAAEPQPASETLTEVPSEADSVEPAPPTPEPAAPPFPPPSAPDWGDLDDLGVSVLSPDAPDAAAPPDPLDPGGWAVLAERERSAPTGRGIVPPVVPPDPWVPPAEPEVVRLTGTFAVPTPTASPQPPTDDADGGASATPEPALADDLDALIESLDTAPRITPDPEFDGPSPDLGGDNVDDLASETLAKIYAAQSQYVEAAMMYERLAARTPERADDLLARAAEMRRHAS